MRVLRGLSSRMLSCGCTTGLYESYSGDVVAILDARGARCDNASHTEGASMALSDVDDLTAAPAAPVSPGSTPRTEG
jgi:hypothetical protein